MPLQLLSLTEKNIYLNVCLIAVIDGHASQAIHASGGIPAREELVD